MSRTDRDLEKNLRNRRPEPPDELLADLVRKATPYRARRSTRRRLVPALGLTLLLAVGLAVFGGFAQARVAVGDTASAAFDKVDRLVSGSSTQGTAASPAPEGTSSLTASNYGASHSTYPRPRVKCWMSASSRKMKVSGTTTVNQGTISVTITKIAGGSDPNFTSPWTAPTLSVTSFNWGPTTQSPQGKRGRTYKATATQTAAGYPTGTGYCYLKFKDNSDSYWTWD